MKCTKCHHPIETNALFCTNCGVKVSGEHQYIDSRTSQSPSPRLPEALVHDQDQYNYEPPNITDVTHKPPKSLLSKKGVNTENDYIEKTSVERDDGESPVSEKDFNTENENLEKTSLERVHEEVMFKNSLAAEQTDSFHVQTIRSERNQSKNRLKNIAERINSLAGIDAPFEIKLKDVFSKVFEKHTEKDAENLFFVGTSFTTPSIEEASDVFPKPWLFVRIFLVVSILYFGLFIGVDLFRNANMLPGLIFLGSFMVPLTILIFFWEINAPRNISIYQVIKILFIGGILSLFIAVFIFEMIISGASVIIIGIVEEVAKLLVILWFLKGKRYQYIFNGLLIGAAVGSGFAAFESAGYALQMAMNDNLERMYSTIFWRGVLAPGGHIVWAALTGAAICMVKERQPFKIAMLKKGPFLRIFLIVIVLHALWNVRWGTFYDIPLAQIIFTIISWVFAIGVMNLAFKEMIQLKKQQTLQTQNLNQTSNDTITVNSHSNISS